jgi:hypothetical protein
LDSNKIDESDLQYEKHDEQRISISHGIVTSSPQPKYRINFEPDESRTNDESTMKREFPDSMEIERFERLKILKRSEISENAEPSIKSTPRGSVIDLRPERENAFDSMRRNSESGSNDIDESDLQSEKHDEH